RDPRTQSRPPSVVPPHRASRVAPTDSDPLFMKYPGVSPYSFTGNNPIQNIDKKGLTKVKYTVMVDDASGRIAIQKTTSNELLHNVKQVIVGHDYERYHEWRDFTELEIQHYRDGKMISSTSTIKPGEKRTTVPYGFGGGLVKAMDWASSKMPSATKEADRDGIVFTTKSKLFPGNDGGKYNAK